MKAASLLRMKQLLELIGIKRATLYDWLNENSPRYDRTFPRPIKIGVSAVAWLSVEIDEWVAVKVRLRDEGRV